MKARYIIACALASLIAVAPLSLVGANAFSYGPLTYDEVSYVSPLAGFVYIVEEDDIDYILTKELAYTYQPDTRIDTVTQNIAELVYQFKGGSYERLYFTADPELYGKPNLQGTNTIFHLNPVDDISTAPRFEYSYPFSITVWADVVVPFDPTAPRDTPRTVHVEFDVDSIPYESDNPSTSGNAIFLDSILDGVAQYDTDLVIGGTTCLFETAVITFSNQSVNLMYDGYIGIPYGASNSFTADVLSRYYTTLPPIDEGDLLDGFEAIMKIPIAFLSTDIIHNFSFGDLFLIIVGFIVFGFAIKLCFGG